MKIITIILTVLSFQSYAQGLDDIQYVTGKLYLSLYQQADAGSSVIKSLVSGDRLDVIEIAGPYAKVITDSGEEGWVKKGFLVKKKPAVILYKESEKTLKELQEKIALNEASFDSVNLLNEEIKILKKENKALNQIKEIYLRQKDNKKIKAEPIKKENIELDTFQIFIKEYIYFLMASFILLLLIGYRIGQLKTESDIIKHFGGVKVW